MRKLCAFLVALAATFGPVALVAAPAHAFDGWSFYNSHDIYPIDNCAISVFAWTQSGTHYVGGVGGEGEGGIAPLEGNDDCAFIGYKVQIKRCDGSYSTTGDLGKFNPTENDVLYRHYFFDCSQALVYRVYFRLDSDQGHWRPVQVSPPDYSYMYHDGACNANCVPW